VLEHQLKALLKQAASRLGLFKMKGKVGSKGDLAEMGTILAHGPSLKDPDKPWRIFLREGCDEKAEKDHPDLKKALTRFEVIKGCVGTPSGKRSICHHTEIAPEGTVLEFEIRWPPKKLNTKDMAMVVAGTLSIGLGSCLSMGFGKFEVVTLEIDD
jgi:hypothetical protein